MLRGAVAGTSPKGPWTDGGTGIRTPDDNNCQSMAHTIRPSMPLVPFSVKMLQIQQGLSLRGGAKQFAGQNLSPACGSQRKRITVDCSGRAVSSHLCWVYST